MLIKAIAAVFISLSVLSPAHAESQFMQPIGKLNPRQWVPTGPSSPPAGTPLAPSSHQPNPAGAGGFNQPPQSGGAIAHPIGIVNPGQWVPTGPSSPPAGTPFMPSPASSPSMGNSGPQ